MKGWKRKITVKRQSRIEISAIDGIIHPFLFSFRSPPPGACNFHAKPMWQYFYRPDFFTRKIFQFWSTLELSDDPSFFCMFNLPLIWSDQLRPCSNRIVYFLSIYLLDFKLKLRYVSHFLYSLLRFSPFKYSLGLFRFHWKQFTSLMIQLNSLMFC